MQPLLRNCIVSSLLVVLVAVIPTWIDRSRTFQVNEGGVVVITGATSGLGKDAAFFFARSGYHVLAGARSESKAAALASEAREAGVPMDNFETVVGDVSNASDHAPLVERAEAAMKAKSVAFTGLVNNAGIHHSSLEGRMEGIDVWRTLYDVNVFAPVALTMAFHDVLIAHKGRVVNVGSVAGEITVKDGGPYCSSKHALRSISDAQRMQYSAHGVSVSLVAPGYVASNMCDPKVRRDCGRLEAKDTTTPAYFDALTSPTPKTKYLVAHIGGGTPAWVATLLSAFVPSRVGDYLQERGSHSHHREG
jgi:NAD(P)-dependent dehydrogenase (short-subunit alcohol dehydrogenase family)